MGIIQSKQGIYYLRKRINKKDIWRSLRTKNLKEAKIRAKKLERKLLSGNVNSKNTHISFTKLSERFIAAKIRKGLSRDSITTYKRVVRRTKDGFYPSNEQTRRLYNRHLSAIYNWGIQNNLVAENPYKDTPKQSIPKVDYYTEEEVKAILKSLGKRKIDDMIRLLFQTGLRRGEAGGLKPENIYPDKIFIVGKTGKRIIPRTKPMKPLLENEEIYTYNPESLGLALQKRKISVTKIRHTFATRLVKNGMDLYRVAKLMGHKSIKTTEKYYAHLKPLDISNHDIFLQY